MPYRMLTTASTEEFDPGPFDPFDPAFDPGPFDRLIAVMEYLLSPVQPVTSEAGRER